MALTINTNVVSINAQRNLGLSGSQLGVSMQRLSSGLRVNSAKDDAAGLAIAERMNAQAKGLAVAARNANDGISLAQTAEGALGKMGDMLQRMRELAVQSSNATNSADDRKALQAEVNQLRSEIDRVAKTTSFNGTKILDGSFAGGVFQVGAGAGDNITVGDITNAKADKLGSYQYGSSTSAAVDPKSVTAYATKIDDKSLKIRVGTNAAVELGEIAAASSGTERMGQVVAAINAKTADTGVTAFLQESKTTPGSFELAIRSASKDSVVLEGFNVALTGFGAVTAAGQHVTSAQYTSAKNALETLATGNAAAFNGLITGATTSTPGFAQAALDAITTNLGTNAGSAVWSSEYAVFKSAVLGSLENTHATPATNYTWTVKASSVADLQAAAKDLLGALDAATWANGATQRAAVYSALDPILATTTTTSAPSITALNNALTAQAVGGSNITMTKTLGASSTAEDLAEWKAEVMGKVDQMMSGGLGIDAATEAKKASGIDKLDIGTQAGAWEAIKQIDSAIDEVNSARAELGALQTRFEKSIENIDIMNENISAARGRIVDADFAAETASLSRTQILQQAGTAMVAQANQLPQQVLSLLQ